jgi:hypothetical protein
MDVTADTGTVAPALPTRAGRLAAGAGFGAVAALVAALVVLPGDDGGEAATDIVARYSEGSAGYLQASVLEGLGVTLFLVFAAALSAVLHRSAEGMSPLPEVAAVGAAVASALQLAGYALIATLAYGTASSGDTALVLAAWDLSSAVFTFSMFGLTVFLAASAAIILRTRVLGRAVGWAAAGTALVTLVASGSLAHEGPFGLHGTDGFIAAVLVHLWVLAASVALLRRPMGR